MPPSRSSPAPAQAPELTSLWCVPTPGARVVGVFARVRVGKVLWTHVMRWKPGHRLEHGAWTRLNIRRAHVLLDPNGEFMCYHARGATGSPFTGTFAGGTTISRLPYLSALTSIITGTAMPLESTSHHELQPEEQKLLRARFGHNELLANWFLRQQPGWKTWSTPQSVHRLSAADFVAAQTPDKPGSDAPMLLVSMKTDYFGSSPRTDRFYTSRSQPEAPDDPVELHPLPVTWAHLRPDGTLLTASLDGVLRTYVQREARGSARKPTPPTTADIPGWRIKTEQSLGDLHPAPKPPPAWAYAPLSDQPAQSAPHNPRATKPGKPRTRRRDRADRERDW